MFQTQAVETPSRTRIIVCALVYAKREYVYQIDTVTFMLVGADNWIPWKPCTDWSWWVP